tara:strand:- start:43 stop:438 length:396 start_codon:yes stop_codon:yes gene_type:complete
MKQEELQNLLDSLMEGPLGKPEVYWDNLEKLRIAQEFNTGKPRSKSTKAKISAKAKLRGNKSMMAPEMRLKASATMSRGVTAYSYPDIKVLGTYKNNEECGNALDIHPSIVATVARGKYKQCKGMTFKYIK